MARVSVFGLGYVGAVTAGCLAHKGHEVVGVDVNQLKIEMMESGRAHVLEPRINWSLICALHVIDAVSKEYLQTPFPA